MWENLSESLREGGWKKSKNMIEKRIIRPTVFVPDANQDFYSVREREAVARISVLKFGGTSVGSLEGLDGLVSTVLKYRREGEQVVVVVSAMKNKERNTCVTGDLKTLANLPRDSVEGLGIIQKIRRQHDDIINSLPVVSTARLDLQDEMGLWWKNLEKDVSRVFESPAERLATITSYGECLSALIVAARLREEIPCVQAIDARKLVVTDAHFEEAGVHRDITSRKTRESLLPLIRNGIVPVVTGYIGATFDGKTTLLGDNSSDYTAVLVSNILGACDVYICKDVDGVLDENGGVVEKVTIDEMYQIKGGTRVICSRALEELRLASMNAFVVNTRTGVVGTRILRERR